GEGDRRRGRGAAAGPDGGTAAAQPRGDPRVLGHARGDGRGDHGRRLAAHRRPGDPGRRRHVYVRGPEEGGAAPPGREPLPSRGRGGTGEPSLGAGGRGRGGSVGAVGGGGQGVRGARARRRRRFPRTAGARRDPARLVQGAPLLAGGRGPPPDPDVPGG